MRNTPGLITRPQIATAAQQLIVLSLRCAEDILIQISRFGRMTDHSVYDEPSEVDADDGIVVVKGPDAVNVRLTARAAEETSERLLHGAMKARGQRYFGEDRPD